VRSARAIDETPRIAGAKACVSFWLNDRRLKAKTDTWECWGLDGASHIGQVRWLARLRKYCFFPAVGMAMEQDYLRSIAQFVECATEKHRKGKRAF
jgi:hypothetical protein